MKKKQRVERRWDKVLAKWYGIPKMARQHAKRHGSSVETNIAQAEPGPRGRPGPRQSVHCKVLIHGFRGCLLCSNARACRAQ